MIKKKKATVTFVNPKQSDFSGDNVCLSIWQVHGHCTVNMKQFVMIGPSKIKSKFNK